MDTLNTDQIIYVDKTKTATMISGLSPGTSYEIAVEAYTDENRVLLVGRIQVTTKQVLPTTTISQVTEQAITKSGTLPNVNWCYYCLILLNLGRHWQ